MFRLVVKYVNGKRICCFVFYECIQGNEEFAVVDTYFQCPAKFVAKLLV